MVDFTWDKVKIPEMKFGPECFIASFNFPKFYKIERSILKW